MAIPLEIKCKQCGLWSEIEFEPTSSASEGGPTLIECATPHCKNSWEMVIPGVLLNVEQSTRNP